VYFDGTSASAALISGLAALWESVFGSSPYDPAVNRQDLFMENANGVPGGFGQEWNNQVGYGVPNAYHVLWWSACWRHDFDASGRVNVIDAQLMAYRWGAVLGHRLYDPRYDMQPLFGDYDIDTIDLQKVFGRIGFVCP
jgi:hypothetical protein